MPPPRYSKDATMDPPEDTNEFPDTLSFEPGSTQQQSSSEHSLRNRRATQWHPPFDADNTSAEGSNPSNDPTMLDILQSLTESNKKLQESLVTQQKLLTTLVKSTSEICQTQKELMKAVLATPSPPNTTARVPPSHFDPSPNDGISLSQSSIQEIGKSEMTLPRNDNDDLSVTSTTSIMGYQDTKLNLEIFQEIWLETSIADAKIWYYTLLSELASKPYYHSLLTSDKKNVHFESPSEGPNATLYSTLQTKLSQRFRTMMLNSGYTTGTDILKFISDSIKILRGTNMNATNAMADFYKLKWDPKKQDIHAFNMKFQNLLNLVMETNPHFTFDQVKFTWIQSLPDEFADLHTKFNKNNLDEKWKNVQNAAHLFILTIEEMRECNITFKSTNSSNEKVEKPVTAKLCKSAPSNHRGHFPSDYPDSTKFYNQVKELVDAGTSKDDIETKFKESYGYKSCWLCRIYPNRPGFHSDNNCPLLEQLFKPYLPSTIFSVSKTVNSLYSRKTLPTSVQRNKEIYKMCYDTGTSPKSLCSHQHFFRDLLMFDHPKHVSLADSDKTARVLGQGTIDFVINVTHLIWLFAFYSPDCDNLMSSADHLNYSKNSILGNDGKIIVSFPTFQFVIKASNNFEFAISAGKQSNLPVLWTPQEQNMIQQIQNDDNTFQIKRLSPDSVLPRRSTKDSTGYDVSASQSTPIAPNSSVTIPLGFSMAFSTKLKCDLRPRSGLSLKGINVALGTIDPDYRGEVKAIVSNTTSTPFMIPIGYRVGQLVFSPVSYPVPVESPVLSPTSRDTNGFGSTGYVASSKSQRAISKNSFSPVLQTVYELPNEFEEETVSTTLLPNSKPLLDSTVDKITHDHLDKLIDEAVSMDLAKPDHITLENNILSNPSSTLNTDDNDENETPLSDNPSNQDNNDSLQQNNDKDPSDTTDDVACTFPEEDDSLQFNEGGLQNSLHSLTNLKFFLKTKKTTCPFHRQLQLTLIMNPST